MPLRRCDSCSKVYAHRQSLFKHKKNCISSSGGPTIEQGKNFVSNQGVGSNHSHSQLGSQRVNMSLFPSDSQFERCVAATNESSNAVQWKDLSKNVIYRVKPQGMVETMRGKDTLIELVDRENRELKVWAPPAVVEALFYEDYSDRDKIAYIRPLDFSRTRKGFETEFLRDGLPSKKSKIELPEQTSKKSAHLLNTMKIYQCDKCQGWYASPQSRWNHKQHCVGNAQATTT